MSETADWLRARVDAMVELTRELVAAESPSDDANALAAAVDLLVERAEPLLAVTPTRLGTANAPALTWSLPAVRSESRPVVLLAHLDTVWATGTLARWPFTVEADRATGPGAFDMKAGLVQGLFALAALAVADEDRPPVVLVVTTDEEIGSPVGRQIVEDAARDAAAVLVLEPSVDGRLKVARKGVSNYDLHLVGRSAHAGLEPELGVNALVAAAGLTLAVVDLAAPELGTTVTPTLASAGTTRNTVPAAATVALDVRASTVGEQQRVDAALRALQPELGATLTVDGGPNRPPMEEQSAAPLVPLAQRAAACCGLPPLETAAVGGGSDGNFTAALGVPTLDGLGAVGAGAHAEGEYVVVSAMPDRAALVAELVVEIGRSLS
ncbi:M20 family metallopeptidase [uncultured Friedmanniella sp.]|uniref:M20 family metallopeptidase n=1 Tax=uncultured Friedmanniella sp. TaxID=335381 RepID=UPI0035CB7421